MGVIQNALVKDFRLDYAPGHDLFSLTLKLDIMGKKGEFRLAAQSARFGEEIKRLLALLSTDAEELDDTQFDLLAFFKGRPLRVAFPQPDGAPCIGSFLRDEFRPIGTVVLLNV